MYSRRTQIDATVRGQRTEDRGQIEKNNPKMPKYKAKYRTKRIRPGRVT